MNCHTVDRSFLTRVELIVLFAFIALGAAILAPELLRADIASDEAQAIADARTVYRAEEAYAAANFGFYSNVTNLCRSGPECSGIGIPGYPATAPEFLPADFGRNLAVRQRRLFPQLGRRLWVQSHPRLGGSQQRDGLLLHHESRSVDGRVAARVRHRWLGAHVLRPDRSGNRMSDTLRHGFARSAPTGFRRGLQSPWTVAL